MVHRPDRLVDIFHTFRKNKLEIKEMRMVHSKEESEAVLVLIKAIKNGKAFLHIDKPLIIYDNNGEYSEEVLKIYNK